MVSKSNGLEPDWELWMESYTHFAVVAVTGRLRPWKAAGLWLKGEFGDIADMPALVAGKEPSDFNDSTGQSIDEYYANTASKSSDYELPSKHVGTMSAKGLTDTNLKDPSCDLAVLEDDVAPKQVCCSAARRRSGHVRLGVRKMITTMWRRLFCGLRPVGLPLSLRLASLVWHIDPGYGAPMTLLATFLWLWPGTSDIMARPDQATKYVWVVGHLYYLVAIIVVSPLGFIPWFFFPFVPWAACRLGIELIEKRFGLGETGRRFAALVALGIPRTYLPPLGKQKGYVPQYLLPEERGPSIWKESEKARHRRTGTKCPKDPVLSQTMALHRQSPQCQKQVRLGELASMAWALPQQRLTDAFEILPIEVSLLLFRNPPDGQTDLMQRNCLSESLRLGGSDSLRRTMDYTISQACTYLKSRFVKHQRASPKLLIEFVIHGCCLKTDERLTDAREEQMNGARQTSDTLVDGTTHDFTYEPPPASNCPLPHPSCLPSLLLALCSARQVLLGRTSVHASRGYNHSIALGFHGYSEQKTKYAKPALPYFCPSKKQKFRFFPLRQRETPLPLREALKARMIQVDSSIVIFGPILRFLQPRRSVEVVVGIFDKHDTYITWRAEAYIVAAIVWVRSSFPNHPTIDTLLHRIQGRYERSTLRREPGSVPKQVSPTTRDLYSVKGTRETETAYSHRYGQVSAPPGHRKLLYAAQRETGPVRRLSRQAAGRTSAAGYAEKDETDDKPGTTVSVRLSFRAAAREVQKPKDETIAARTSNKPYPLGTPHITPTPAPPLLWGRIRPKARTVSPGYKPHPSVSVAVLLPLVMTALIHGPIEWHVPSQKKKRQNDRGRSPWGSVSLIHTSDCASGYAVLFPIDHRLVQS
ncbi:hypothetical protein CCUS01_02769 [Colletotrichum cuscutae]|uniref:Uncharacterized protein n=1 Tax=Colletotrichum cuscutae TaxID=1209917 RepID=A0AAI9YC52_9PEZI|nr:hypothetical protein CCUS01_02769 [Colletotrichum cuscutae]